MGSMGRRTLSRLLLCFLGSFLFISISTPTDADAAVVVNEFTVAGTEWVELFNTDDGSNVDLTSWSIQETSGGQTISLSGTLPRNGLLTFTPGVSDFFNNSNSTLNLRNAASTVVNSVAYGGGGDVAAPSSAQSAQRTTDGGDTWAVTTSSSRGWFNNTNVPRPATIDASLESTGVTTNLGEQTDLSRASGLYFERTGRGRLQFNAVLNLTDTAVSNWLQNLGSRLEMSTRGTIGLNADDVRNFIDTGATLTMFGLSFGSTPRVLVDGARDTGGVVSNLSYDPGSGNLIFTAAHFTTFRAEEIERTGPLPFDLDTPKDGETVSDAHPTFSFNVARDEGSGMKEYRLFVDNALWIDNIPANLPAGGALAIDDSDKYVQYNLPFVRAWSKKNKLTTGRHVWQVKAYDAENNLRDSSERVLYYDPNYEVTAAAKSSPALTTITSLADTGSTPNRPSFFWVAFLILGPVALTYLRLRHRRG